MDDNFQKSLGYTLQFEGGWSKNAADPGGATMKGVTLATYTSFCAQCGKDAPSDGDLHDISDEDLSTLYYNNFWKKVGADQLAGGVDAVVWDWGVNSGPGRPIKAMQTLVAHHVDGKLTPELIAAMNALPAEVAIERLSSARKQFFYDIVNHRPASNVFLKGWLSRVAKLEVLAHEMAGHDGGDGKATSDHPDHVTDQDA